MGDVRAVEGAFEGDGVDALIGFVDGSADIFGCSNDAENASAVRDDPAVFFSGAGMEDMRAEGLRLLEAINREAFLVGFRVAAGGDDDADCCPIAPFDVLFVEGAVGAGEHDVDEIALEERQDDLRLGSGR